MDASLSFDTVSHCVGVNFQTQLFQHGDRHTPTIDRVHLNQSERFQLAKCSQQVRLRAVCQSRQLDNGLRLGVPDRA